MRRLAALLLLGPAAAAAQAPPPDYAAEAAELLRTTAAPLSVSAAELRRLQAAGARPPVTCPLGDHGCAGRVQGLRPPARPAVSLAAPEPFCLAGRPGAACGAATVSLFPAGIVAATAAAAAGDLADASFIHLRGRPSLLGPGSTFVGTVRLRSRWQYGTIRLLAADPGVANLLINGWPPALAGVRRGPICRFADGPCQRALFAAAQQPAAGVDVTRLFDREVNVVYYLQLRESAAESGVLLQLVRDGDLFGPPPAPCPAAPPPDCAYQGEPACVTRIGGVCIAATRTLACGQAGACRRLACPGGACDAPPPAGDGAADVQRALANLEIGRQATRNYKLWEASVFKGHRSECRDKIAWGLGDCCKASAAGRETSNKQALARLGLRHAISQVAAAGSPHTHDVLFLTADLGQGLKALGRGRLAALQPSLSYYGLKVSLGGGVLKFSFDPASFAAAVALAVIANLLECSAEEKLLGLRVGAGLCRHQRSWCSKRRFFGCKEEREAYCCHRSRLAKAAAAQLDAQLGKPAGFCGGYTVAELQRVDLDKVDMSEFIADFGVEVDQELLRQYRWNSLDYVRYREWKASSKRP